MNLINRVCNRFGFQVVSFHTSIMRNMTVYGEVEATGPAIIENNIIRPNKDGKVGGILLGSERES